MWNVTKGRSSSSSTHRAGVASGVRSRESRADRALFVIVLVDVCLLAFAGGPPPNEIAIAMFVLVAVALTGLLALTPLAREHGPSLWLRGLLIAIVALPTLQLVPLPPVLWHSLPGGDLRKDVLTLVGAAQSWQPLSLVPLETGGAVLLAYSFVALLAAMIALSRRRFEQLLMIIELVVLVNITIGIIQVASGGSPHLVTKADHGALLGFFANKNHAGVTLAAGLALFAYIVEIVPVLRAHRAIWLAAALLSAFICVVPTNSRAGLLLTLGSGLWIALRFIVTGKRRTRIAVGLSGVVLAALLSLSPVFDRVYHRFDAVGQDPRWRYVQQSMPLLENYGLLGVGGGGFYRVFIVNEQLDWVKPTFVNEAHNEYLQTAIEYGVPGILLIFAAIATLIYSGWSRWWQTVPGSAARRQLEVGGVIVLLFLLHSVADYPLRRPACWALFAAGCAMIVRNISLARRGGGQMPVEAPRPPTS